MQVVVITGEIKERIEKAIELASNNPRTVDALTKLMESTDELPDDFHAEYTVLIPMGISVTYTHDEAMEGLMCRHISICGNVKEKVVDPHTVKMIMEEYGFINTHVNDPEHEKRPIVRLEYNDSGAGIIHALEPLDGDMSKLRKQA